MWKIYVSGACVSECALYWQPWAARHAEIKEKNLHGERKQHESTQVLSKEYHIKTQRKMYGNVAVRTQHINRCALLHRILFV